MASARIVAVVVPSPATSFVLLAASFTNWAPRFSYASSSSMSSATVTPSLVTLGEPQPLSSTAFRPRGPSVLRTARARLATPEANGLRASSSKTICFATGDTPPRDGRCLNHGQRWAASNARDLGAPGGETAGQF